MTEKNFKINLKNITETVISFLESKWFVFITFGLFILQALYIAFATKTGIPPDENHHIALIRFLSESGWLPFVESQEGYFKLGEITNSPFVIYHYSLSLIYSIFGGLSVFVMRLSGILLGVLSMLTFIKLSDALKISHLARNVSLFMFANTIMFVYISASVNYDNLFIFVTLLSLLMFVQLSDKFNLNKFLIFVIAVAIGVLTKLSFVPVAVIISAMLIYTYGKNINKFKPQIRKFRATKLTYLIGSVALILVFIASAKYIPNIINYGALKPACDNVHSLEECLQNPVFARNYNYENGGATSATLSTGDYAINWGRLMFERTYGVFGHESYTISRPIAYGIMTILLIGMIATIRLISRKDRKILSVLLFAVAYCAVLFWSNNGAYNLSGVNGLAVQGRYALPALAIFYLIFNQYSLKLFRNNYVKTFYIAFVLMVFSLTGIYSFIKSTGDQWITDRALTTHQSIRSRL